ncbi:MAG: DinB family protein [Acidobacteria bacterium]|nr:DinB family protein [Acidobacteriota bacterium]
MTPSYVLIEENVANQIAEIRVRLDRLCAGLSPAQLNWQGDAGRQWSVGQCLDHVTRTTNLYGGPLETAIAVAPPAAGSGARPNWLGRAFIWAIEPPVRLKVPAPESVQPGSTLDPAIVRTEAEGALVSLQALAIRAVGVDAGRLRFANPFARGIRVFNVATGVLVMLAHTRRHLEQAERIRARPDFPSACS